MICKPVRAHMSPTKAKYPAAKRRSGVAGPVAVNTPPSTAASRKATPAGRRPGSSRSKEAQRQLGETGYISDQKKVVFAYKKMPASHAAKTIRYRKMRPSAASSFHRNSVRFLVIVRPTAAK